MNTMRKVLSATALVAAGALVLTGCSNGAVSDSSSSESKTMTVVSYGGPYQEAQSTAFFQPFSEQSGVEVVEDSPTDYAQLRSMVETERPTWDLVLVANDFGTTADAKYLEPIDYDVVDKSSLIDGAAQEYRVAADIEATVLAYRSDEYATAPGSWAELFDTKKYPGKRMFNKLVSGGVLEAALLADGVAPDDLFPLDVDRALKKLDTIKDDIVWWETSAQSQQLLASGEAAMGLAWVGRAVDAGKEAPVGISWDSWLQVDAYWVIPKGAPNAKNAQSALGFLLGEEPQVEFAKLIDYGPANKAAAENAEIAKNENRPTNHLDTQVAIDDEWWGANQQDTDRKFQEWLLS